VKIDLPKASSTPNITQPENIQLAVRANGEVFWNGQPIAAAQLASRMSAAARLDPQPELHLRADRTTPYEKVAQVMSAAAKAGLTKIGFVTEPRAP
jgi:biopolymer transport protein ExbD